MFGQSSYVDQALSRKDRPCHSLHASANSEYGENLIIDFLYKSFFEVSINRNSALEPDTSSDVNSYFTKNS